MCYEKGHGIIFFIINAYKPSKPINNEFLSKLEDFLFLNKDNSEPLFMFDDLNMDLNSGKGEDLKDFLITNFKDDYTRIATYECSNSGELRTKNKNLS